MSGFSLFESVIWPILLFAIFLLGGLSLILFTGKKSSFPIGFFIYSGVPVFLFIFMMVVFNGVRRPPIMLISGVSGALMGAVIGNIIMSIYALITRGKNIPVLVVSIISLLINAILLLAVIVALIQASTHERLF